MRDSLIVMFAVLLALILPFGCSRSCCDAPATVELPRAEINLTSGWNQTPWIQNQQQSNHPQPIVLTNTFSLSSGLDLAGSELVLEQLWWSATVELNDSNFDDIVFKSGKSAFVKFLAPW